MWSDLEKRQLARGLTYVLLSIKLNYGDYLVKKRLSCKKGFILQKTDKGNSVV